MICGCCHEERKQKSKPPREAVELPKEATEATVFKHPGLPVYLCEFCDGDALPSALFLHQSP